MSNSGHVFLLKDLRSISRDELIERYDNLVPSTSVGVNYYLEELHRRDLDDQGQRMLELTQDMRDLTDTIKKLTIFNVVVASAAFIVAIASVIVAVSAS